MISRNSVTQLWLVTHYHKHGSLYDYLNNKAITQVQLLKFAYSIANGLAFLHSEMVGTEVIGSTRLVSGFPWWFDLIIGIFVVT